MNRDALVAHLTALGLHDADGVRRRARLTKCRGCTEPILTGLDANVAGLPVEVDLDDLDRLAEFLVLSGGRRTYRIFELPDGLQINRREPEVIGSDRQARPVVAGHRCGATRFPSSANRWKPLPNTLTTDHPPF